MKRLFAFFFAFFFVVMFAVPCYAEGASILIPATTADAYVVMNADTGQILIEKNMHKREFPASITKVLTVALGLEAGDFDDAVVVDKTAVTSAGSHIALQADEQLTLRDLSYAAMLPSANDAANAIAVHTAGSLDAFAERMNQKADQLGCLDTHFSNAKGMPDENHYTTAYDMALLTRYALSVPDFPTVFGGKEYMVPPTNKQSSPRKWGTDHMMLVPSAYVYEGTLGGKLGWTEDAQHTAVTLVQRGDMRLICVVMKDTRYEKFKDSIALYDYCFQNFVSTTVDGSSWDPFAVQRQLENGTEETLSIYGDTAYQFLIHKSVAPGDITMSFSVPPSYQAADEIAPVVHFSVKDMVQGMYHEIGDFPMLYRSVSPVNTAEGFDREPVTLGQGIVRALLIVVLGSFGLVALVFLAMVVIRYINKYRKWKRRKARMDRLKQYYDPTLSARLPPPGPPPRQARPLPTRRKP